MERRLVCSKCGTENEAGLRFCDECGSPLVTGCPGCGTVNRSTAKFCGVCGTDLSVVIAADIQSAPVPAAAPVAQRRLVSVLFADLVGFTTLTEGQDAEDTRELLNRYFDLARDVIGRYGGMVEKFIGDAVMAVWGAPTAHEDDAERAVRAGLELVDAVKALGPGIRARAGILTGEAAVTLGATNQGMVAGDLVNTASRLQSAAQPGAVLVGEATQRAASRAIAFEPAGEQELKGKAAPVSAWRALRVIAQVGGRNRAETLEAPFVGRDDELRLIKDLFHATTRERRARLVSIIGPAGIGKTRLAWEFGKYRDGLIETVWFHDGRSPAYGEGISFWALGQMVRSRCGLREIDDERTTRAKIAETVARHVGDEAERRWVEGALLALLGIDTKSAATDELFAAWRTFFERMAASAPVVLVFEDFHHADSGLVDFVDHLLEWSRTVPIYIVTLARPEFLERRPDWGAGKRSFTSIFLEPLSPATMKALLAGLVPGLPESAVATIVARADGVPLYAVETVRMLLADGKLVLEGDSYRPIGDLTDLAVPETLTALIASRLDGLPADDRALVCDAAVLGQSFTLAGLSIVSGVDVDSLATRLRALIRRELITLESDPRSPERGRYAFVQALIREVAYGTLAKRDRVSRHLAAARFFESLDTDEMAGGLAAHYLAARRNASEGPEADAVAAQARSALRDAGERAASLGSHDQALAFWDQALTVTTDPEETAELLERAGEAASAAGHHASAEDRLRRAIQARRDLGERVAIARAVATLGRALLDGSRRPEALGLLEPATAEFADISSEPAVIALRGQLARAYQSGMERQALEVVEGVLEAAELADLTELLAEALVTKGTALAQLGRVVEGLGVLRTGQDLAQEYGLSRTELRATDNRTSLEFDRDPRVAFELGAIGVTLARRLGRRADAAWIFGLAAWCALRTGDWPWAIAELDTWTLDELDVRDRVEIGSTAVLFRAFRGLPVDDLISELVEFAGDRPDRPIVFALESMRMFTNFAADRLPEACAARRLAAEAIGEPGALSNYGARAALWSRDLAGAVDDLATSAGGKHGKVVIADRLTIKAGIAALEGRPDDALPMYRDALRAWRDLRLAWDEALCGIDMATLLDPTEPEVLEAVNGAREILVRLEAAPFISRLDAALARSSDAAVNSPLTSGNTVRDTSVTTP